MRRPLQTKLAEDLLEEGASLPRRLLGVTDHQEVVHKNEGEPPRPRGTPPELARYRLRDRAEEAWGIQVPERQPQATHQPTGARVPHQQTIP